MVDRFLAASLPSLTTVIPVSQQWLGEDYPETVVEQVLNARDHLPVDIKRNLDTAIRNCEVRVPGAQFQLKDVYDAPTHHLLPPVLRKMGTSDELAEVILRAWAAVKNDLYENVVQHLLWNDEPTYGPDRGELCFRGYWDATDWQRNFNQVLADHSSYDRNDVALMLWYASGQLPPTLGDTDDSSDQVDFQHWKELLRAVPAEASVWEQALTFAADLKDILAEKREERSRMAVSHLKAKIKDIWLEYSEELVYLEKNIGGWAFAGEILPEDAMLALEKVNNLDLLLDQYRPIRDQAQSRSVENSRAGRRAELESEIIASVVAVEPLFRSGAVGSWLETVGATKDPTPEPPPVRPETVPTEPAPASNNGFRALPMDFPGDGTADANVPPELPHVVPEPTPEPTPEPVQQEAPAVAASSNDSILAKLTALAQDLELLRSQVTNGTGAAGKQGERVIEGRPSPPDSPVEVASRSRGLAAAVARAERIYSRQLQFRLNPESSVADNPFEDSQSVFDALEWLASTYYSARQETLDAAILNESLYRICRWKYAGSQWDDTFFESEGRYRMLVNGNAYFLNETVGKGMGNDPVNTIRIAFYWDAQREKVVIGYIGRHRGSSES